MKTYYIYIMTNHSGTLYTSTTDNLEQRIYEHKHKLVPGFASKYNIMKLVYYEEENDASLAHERKKLIKSWSRAKKIALIESVNPEWRELSPD
jgi:putative endonuclease